MATSSQAFEQVIQKLRWKPRSIECARDVLVGGMTVKDAALKHDMSAAQVSVIRSRFMEKLRAMQLVRISADEYMSEMTTLQVFRPELMKLRNKGYSDLLLLDFLAKNGVVISSDELVNFLDSTGNPKQS